MSEEVRALWLGGQWQCRNAEGCVDVVAVQAVSSFGSDVWHPCRILHTKNLRSPLPSLRPPARGCRVQERNLPQRGVQCSAERTGAEHCVMAAVAGGRRCAMGRRAGERRSVEARADRLRACQPRQSSGLA